MAGRREGRVRLRTTGAPPPPPQPQKAQPPRCPSHETSKPPPKPQRNPINDPQLCSTARKGQLVEGDVFDLPPGALPEGQFNLYIYDGAHDYESQVRLGGKGGD